MVEAAGRPCGPTDKASDYESGDSRFESWQGRFFFCISFFHVKKLEKTHAHA